MKRLLSCLLIAGCFLYAAESEKPDRVVNITAQRYHFHPAEIHVKKGELVELRFTSLDTDHGVLIPHLMLRSTIPPKGKGALTVRFRATEVGRWWFESSHPSGANYSLMRGIVDVE